MRVPTSQVYEVVYHAIVRYGKDFEEHLQAVAKDTTDVRARVEKLYDCFRAIVIDDATSVGRIGNYIPSLI